MALSDQEIRTGLIVAGVKNLKEYGYPNVDNKNILTEDIYKAFFLAMLKENKGQSTKQIDNQIDQLIKELE